MNINVDVILLLDVKIMDKLNKKTKSVIQSRNISLKTLTRRFNYLTAVDPTIH